MLGMKKIHHANGGNIKDFIVKTDTHETITLLVKIKL